MGHFAHPPRCWESVLFFGNGGGGSGLAAAAAGVSAGRAGQQGDMRNQILFAGIVVGVLAAPPAALAQQAGSTPTRYSSPHRKSRLHSASVRSSAGLWRGFRRDQLSIGGVPTVNLVVSARYTHAHNGVMDRADFDGMVDLVVALVRKLDAGTVARLRDFTPEP
jgi:hypothetical protein